MNVSVAAVGVSFGKRPERLQALHEGATLIVVPEPDNPHDPNAMKVLTFSKAGLSELGYLPRAFVERFDLGCGMLAAARNLRYHDGRVAGFDVSFRKGTLARRTHNKNVTRAA